MLGNARNTTAGMSAVLSALSPVLTNQTVLIDNHGGTDCPVNAVIEEDAEGDSQLPGVQETQGPLHLANRL